jgi:hypothetical protein
MRFSIPLVSLFATAALALPNQLAADQAPPVCSGLGIVTDCINLATQNPATFLPTVATCLLLIPLTVSSYPTTVQIDILLTYIPSSTLNSIKFSSCHSVISHSHSFFDGSLLLTRTRP